MYHCSASDDMAAEEIKLSLKLVVDNSSHKVLFAESAKDFVDLLISYLTMPLGSVIRLLTKSTSCDLSISKLYESVGNLDEIYILSRLDKNSLMDLVTPSLSRCSSSFLTSPLLLHSDDSFDAKEAAAATATRYYVCQHYCSGPHYFTNVRGTRCPRCNREMESEAVYVASSPPGGVQGDGWWREEGRGFVKGVVTYMVMDDLTVMPISSSNLLNKLNVKEMGALEEKIVQVGVEEVLLLLKASLQSKTVLTDVLLKKEENKYIRVERICAAASR